MPEPLAIYSAVNVSYGLAKELYGLLESWAKASDEARTYKVRFGATQAQLQVFCDFVRENEKSIAPGTATLLQVSIHDLNAALLNTKAKIEKYDVNTWHRRLQWPWVAKSLDKAEQALASWVKRMTNTFMFLPQPLKQEIGKKLISQKYAKMTFPLVALQEHIAMRLKQSEIQTLDTTALLSTLKDEPQDNEVQMTFYWKDLVGTPPEIQKDKEAFEAAKVEYAKLAEVLKLADSKLTSIPKAHSWFQRDSDVFGIAYELPPSIQLSNDYPQKTPTLKDLVKKSIEHPLNDRLRVAIEIASAVAYVHGLEWVHKRICSDNILLLYKVNSDMPPRELGRANLVGFTVSRRNITRSRNIEQVNKLDWRQQIYSHPLRQQANIMEEEDAFYQLTGATALTDAASNTDGLNETQQSNSSDLVSPNDTKLPDEGLATTNEELSTWERQPEREFYKYKHDIYSLGVVLLELGMWVDLAKDDTLKNKMPDQRQKWLCDHAGAKGALVQRMGQRYADVVRACLDIDNKECDIEHVLTELYEIRF